MCRSRFGVLDYMSNDIYKNDKNNIAFVGISNENHSKNQIPKMIQGTTLPWAHDNSGQDVWSKWGVRLRDLYILNEEGILYGMVNLTGYDPDPQVNGGNNYNDLKQLILDAKKTSSSN